jgi:hypothetical protein
MGGDPIEERWRSEHDEPGGTLSGRPRGVATLVATPVVKYDLIVDSTLRIRGKVQIRPHKNRPMLIGEP